MRDITVRRPDANGSYDDATGLWVEPARTESTIRASVQRLSPRDIQLLREADQQKESRKLYTSYSPKIQKDETMEASDYFIIDGLEFMAVGVEDFYMNQRMTLKHYKIIVVSTNPKAS
jgi:hypothetical protein